MTSREDNTIPIDYSMELSLFWYYKLIPIIVPSMKILWKFKTIEDNYTKIHNQEQKNEMLC